MVARMSPARLRTPEIDDVPTPQARRREIDEGAAELEKAAQAEMLGRMNITADAWGRMSMDEQAAALGRMSIQDQAAAFERASREEQLDLLGRAPQIRADLFGKMSRAEQVDLMGRAFIHAQ